MLQKKIILLSCLGLALHSCGQKQLSPPQLEQYVEDASNGLNQTQHVNGIDVSVKYQPVDLIVSRELQGEPEGSISSVIDSLRNIYGRYSFFTISFSKNSKEILQPQEGFSTYSELLQTLAFRMDKEVEIITSRGDTLYPVNYYLDRSYATANASQLLFAFQSVKEAGDCKIRIKEFGLVTGTLIFSFDDDALKATPSIQLN
ncbi:hypothetical protein [Hymenobacter sublimis]|uniref:Uncharacterized protein n=1 Tax=Hymenobacter sublimis TaxID=2933777 RepID=A0ABY4JBJ8_9BACT|nr:hypothetical protein [Hymenobacter sublimis]UPL50200.1 hypothetical protein MWH26_04650 [Hymenobacter sublimis]